MARPQTYIRGLHRAGSYMATGDGIFLTPYSTTVAAIDSDSTGIVLAGGIQVSGATNARASGNSTGVLLNAGLMLSGKTGVKLTANTTAIIATALRLGSTAVTITVNSTGYLIGSRYISTNTTGNLAT